MSDTPPPPADVSQDEQPSGGWQRPSTTNAWRAPERSNEPQGWRVPALPQNLDEQPAETGAWHLPKAEDTTFTPEAVIEIKPPEDALLEFNPTPSVMVTPPPNDPNAIAPEDALFSAAQAAAPGDAPAQPSTPVAPEDLLLMLEHIDEEEDDFNTLQMSELMALANLADSQPVQAIPGAESPIVAGLTAAANQAASPAANLLSPAERAVLTPGVDDAAEYARKQLEQLGADEEAAPAGTVGVAGGTVATPTGPEATGIGSGTAAVDAAAYAREQLQQLGVETEVEPAAPAEVLNPREQDLARRYHETQDRVRQLRAQVQAGQLSQDDFLNQLRDLMVLDDEQQWWMMGVESDSWYRAEGDQWVQDSPSVLEKEERIQQQQAGDLNRFVQQPLDYLPDSQPQAAVTGEFTSPGGEIRLDENFMPLPREVPVNDPDFTVPNPAVIGVNTVRSNEAATIPGASFYDATVPSPAAGPTVAATPVSYGTVESPYDVTEPPDYELEAEKAAPIYEEAAERQRQSAARTVFLIVAGIIILVLLIGVGGIAASLLWYQGIVDQWEPQIVALANYQPPFQTVTILDSAGGEIATLGRDGADRREIALTEISPYFLHAVISLEDPNFYDDPGWNLLATINAFTGNLTGGGGQQGSDTITQQVARNFVIQNADLTNQQEINEIVVAGELTRRYSKNDILELFVNEVAFGNQIFGVEAAARFYFDKPARDLNLPEAALLASLIRAPAATNPVTTRDASFELMDVTLQRMAEVQCLRFLHDAPGVAADTPFCVTQAQVNSGSVAIEKARVETREYLPRDFNYEYPHFVQLVEAQLQEYFGADQLYRGGYTVVTTLDPDTQDAAQSALEDAMQRLGATGVNTGSIVVINPQNGAVLAMVGSPDFNNPDIGGQNNYSLTYRQPGPVIQPIVYATTLQGIDTNGNGTREFGEYMTPATIIWDVPTTYDIGGQTFTPVNFDRIYHGATALRAALQNNYNVAAIKALEFVGLDNFRALATAMGIRFRDDAVFGLTTAQGATEASLYDMTIAYATIANNGTRLRPFFISRIVDAQEAEVPLPARPEPVQAVSPGVAFLLQDILRDDAARQPTHGLNSALNIPELNGRIAAQAGISEGARDLWTIGFTNNRVVGVWMGNNNGSPTTNDRNLLAAAPVWNQVMRAALQEENVGQFNPPTNLVTQGAVCDLTGTLADNNCAARRNEWWLVSQPPPTTAQGLVSTIQVDAWTGLLVNPTVCPTDAIPVTVLNTTDEAAINWINTTNAGQQWARQVGLTLPVQRAPTGTCDGTNIPSAVVSYPTGGITLQNTVEITGIATAPDFASYSVEFAPVNTNSFRLITNSNQPQTAPNSVLARWDTTAVTNGDYTLQLTMISQTGRRITRQETVRIANIPPTPTPAPPTPFPTQPPLIVPTNPLPFEPLPPTSANPAPTVNPLGGS
ncbi:MAG: transglycosylase domain-containing protein [bacterium]|nr:transglycosylase domain-containing protein [bacterium]